MGRQLNARAQRGEALLLTLMTLMVLMLGFLYAMRNVMSDSLMAGNHVARQKAVQIADIAARNLQQDIATTSAGSALESSALDKPWWRTVPSGTAAPDASYWSGCSGNGDSASRCAAVSLATGAGTVSGYSAFAVVQPTGRTDPYACSLAQFTAVYYDVFIQVREDAGASSAVTETIYKLCVNT